MQRYSLPILLFSLLAAIAFADPIPVGPGRVVLGKEEPIEVFTYRPPTYVDGPLILIFHGVGRNAEEYRNFAITLAERFGAIIAAPHFDKARFPYNDYQQGGILREGVARPRGDWTFSRLPAMISALQEGAGNPRLPYYILGHSAGGQFVARLAATAGALGAQRLIAANPGSHLFPTREAKYGYGFGGLPDELANDEAIKRFLAAPLTLYLGTADNDPNHPSLDRSEAALLQGPHRYGRGLNCFATAQELARSRGWAFNWRKVEVDGIAHEAARMFAAPEAENALFGASRP